MHEPAREPITDRFEFGVGVTHARVGEDHRVAIRASPGRLGEKLFDRLVHQAGHGAPAMRSVSA